MDNLRQLARWPALLVFAVMAVSGGLLGWTSYGLVQLAMANERFITEHGSLAIMEGALGQTLEIVVRGLIALLCYLLFKACEVELVARIRRAR